MSTTLLWLVCVSSAVLGSILYNIAIKVAGTHISVFLFSFLLASVAAIGHLIVIGALKYVIQPDVKLHYDTTGLWMVAIAGLAVFMIDFGYFFAIKYGGIASSQVFWSVGGIVLVVPMAALLFKETINMQNIIGIVLGIAALILVSKK